MKTDIILAGVGGQGVLSLASIIGLAALEEGLHLKQSETHGMSQRGGAVVSHVRLSDRAVFADLIHHGQADLILAVEPMEALRQLPFLMKDGYLITNTDPFTNLPNYPDMEKIEQALNQLPKVLTIDATDLARDLGHAKSSNIVMLGALSAFVHISIQAFEKGIEAVFAGKGEDVVEINRQAFHLGRKVALTTV